MSIKFTVRSASDEALGRIVVEPRQVILGGYSARSVAERERHIAELRQIGIEPPARVPAFWRVSTWLLTTGREIEVQGETTSGEIEYALIGHAGRTYVAAASDQTDRDVERSSIPRSKQLCPKVLSADVLPLNEVLDRWDEIVIASWVGTDGETWIPYQRSPLGAMMDPMALTRAACRADSLSDGTVLLSGTIPLLDAVTRYDSHFRGTLTVPESGPELQLAYGVHVLPEVVTATDRVTA